MKQLVTQKKIPAAAYIIKLHDECKVCSAVGSFLNNMEEEVAVTVHTRFDVASLTKVMCTLPAMLLLHERKVLSIDDPVGRYISQFSHPNITIRHLLQHTSGLVADLTYKNRLEARDVFADILQCKTGHLPGEKVVYSDLGMILAGKVIERVTGMELDSFAAIELYRPWGMAMTGFLPNPADVNDIAATEKVAGKYVHGEVHDEKAFQLGGVSGSAGLFSTVEDVAKYADYWLYPEKQSVLKRETMELALSRPMQNRGLGFEVVQEKDANLSCGRLWSVGSYGHTGFTGTSLWIDPKEEIIAVLLTNMVHYGRDHHLPEIRKKFHTYVNEQLIDS